MRRIALTTAAAVAAIIMSAGTASAQDGWDATPGSNAEPGWDVAPGWDVEPGWDLQGASITR